MYRIRLQSGEEAVYKTVEELAAAVTSGMISPTAEVFHKAGNRWLPINTHPDYRAVITGKRQALQQQTTKELQQAAAGAPPAQQPQSPVRAPTRKSQPAIELEPMMPVAGPPTPAPPTVQTTKVELPERLVEQPARLELQPAQPGADAFSELAPEPEVIVLDSSRPPIEPAPEFTVEPDIEPVLPPGIERPKPPVVPIAIGVTGLLVAAAIAAILFTRPARPTAPEAGGASGRPFQRPAPVVITDSAPPPQVTRGAKPVPEKPGPEGVRLARPDTIPVVYPAPSKPLVPGSRSATPAAPATSPPRTISRMGTTVNKLPSYYEAYADARAEMDESLTYVDFRRVFAPYRFQSADSIRATRRMVAAAGNILRVYRGREVMLEQTYRPGEPEGKGSLRESFEVSEASRALLQEVDSLFAILVGQEGEVKYRDNQLSFQNGRAAQAYSSMRRQILQTLAYLGDPAEAADRVTMPRLLRGIGSDRPPPAR